jgi:E-phenylitaconyl-CoA hydratase
MAVDVSVQDRIATVTLNRPDSMNSIDPAMRRELHAAWQRIASDEEIRVAIITGAGDRAFCAGADLKNTPPPAESHAALTFGDTRDHILHGLDTDKPLVCAINGHAVGAGLEIALACDIRIAATGAKFGLPEVRVGSVPGAGGTQLLPRTVGRSNAMQMLLTGELIDAETALRWGLVSEVHDLAVLHDRARALAERIAANAPLSVRAVKRLASRGLDVPLPTGMEMERYVFGLLRDTEDRLEGRKAFQEKRPPEFLGR